MPFTLELIGIILYGVLCIAGGILGYVKSRSQASLISGGISGLLLLILARMVNLGKSWAVYVAATIVFLLIMVFVVRWFKSKKPMPAIPMIFLGIVSLILILKK